MEIFMTIRHLKVFISVVENGGITKAAEVLRVAQPAVSQTISDLEKYYNVILFDRINNKIVLTENGKNLFLKAKETVASFDDFESVALSALKNPTVHVGASVTVGETGFKRIAKYASDALEGVKLTFRVKKSREIEREILDGSIDFGIVDARPQEKNVKAVEIARDKLVAVRGYDGENHVSTLEQLSKAPLCLTEKGTSSREFVEDLFGARGLVCKPMLDSESNRCAIEFAKTGLGVAILPYSVCKDEIEKGNLALVEVSDADMSKSVYVVCHKNKKFTRVQKFLYDYCCNSFSFSAE